MRCMCYVSGLILHGRAQPLKIDLAVEEVTMQVPRRLLNHLEFYIFCFYVTYI